MASHSWVSILRTLFLILLLTPVSTLGHLSNIQTPKGPSLEGRSQQPSPSDSLSSETRHNLSQLSASDERTLQREFLLQQFIHRLTTTPHQTILRTQVSWESSGTLHWITFLNRHLRMRPILACTPLKPHSCSSGSWSSGHTWRSPSPTLHLCAAVEQLLQGWGPGRRWAALLCRLGHRRLRSPWLALSPLTAHPWVHLLQVPVSSPKIKFTDSACNTFTYLGPFSANV